MAIPRIVTPIAGARARPASAARSTLCRAVITLVGACLVAATASRAQAQDASAQGEASRTQELQFTVAAPADRSQTLVIKIVVEQPYIDHVATGVTYDGWDRVFGIEWKEGNEPGRSPSRTRP